MKCSDAHELINAYIDNGIDPSNDKLLQEHLEGCKKCRAELEFLTDYKKKLAEIRPVRAPAGFMEELKRRIEAENARPYLRYFSIASEYIRSIHFPVEAAALVVLVSIVFTLYRPDKLFMNRPAVTVTEYSETGGNGKTATTGKDEGFVPRSASREAYDDRRKFSPQVVTADKSYPGEKENAGGIDDVVKEKSSETEELALSEERVSDRNIVESSAADKKDTARSESRVMGKQRLDAATEITPGDVCRRYNAEVVGTKKLASGPVEYTIKMNDENSDELLSGLRRYFTVKFKSKEKRNGHTYLIIEIME